MQRPSGATAEMTMTLYDDGTFTSTKVSGTSFFPGITTGHWALTPTGMLTWVGSADGFAVRSWGPAELDDDGQTSLTEFDSGWSSSTGGRTEEYFHPSVFEIIYAD